MFYNPEGVYIVVQLFMPEKKGCWTLLPHDAIGRQRGDSGGNKSKKHFLKENIQDLKFSILTHFAAIRS